MLKKHDKTAAYALLAVGTVQLILILSVILGYKSDIISLFLFDAFHLGAIYIPCLSFAGSYLILKKPFKMRLFQRLVSSVFMFFPLASIVKIILSDRKDPIINALHNAFDKPGENSGSIIVLVCVTVIIALASRIVIKKLNGEISEEEIDTEEVESINPLKEPEVFEVNYTEEIESVNPLDELDDESDDELDDELDDESLGAQIDEIKNEINEYYIEEEKNIPFEEPSFPEVTETVDIDALDESNNLLSEIIETELTKEEEDYLNSFDEVETFSALESVEEPFELEEDPAIKFLSDDTSYIEDDIEEDYIEEADRIDVKIDFPEEPPIERGRILMAEREEYDDINKEVEYSVPVNGLLGSQEDSSYMEIDEATKRSAAILEQTLEEFNIKGKVTGIKKGPVITMFELLPAPGVKLSKIVNLSDNIALGLAASSVRIVAPIPGKHAVGIEVPNKKRAIVTFSELIESEDDAYNDGAVPIILGKNINGDNKIIDLAKTPHLLIAGATGAGKSVCVNSLICSILCKRSHNDVKMIMVDPKIVELKLYNGIPHLLTPVITDPKRAFQAIQWCLFEMERRYALLDSMGVRDIKTYNQRIKEQKIATTKLPYMVLIVDEFADLMATSGKELEGILARLAAMSRAVGIHLVLATQRPSIDVITGLIKANFPSRIAFMVSSKTDSRIILDNMGAEKLLGRGDMLFTSSWDPFPVRIQGSFLSDEEVESVVDYVKGLGEPEYIDDEIFMDDDDEGVEEKEKSFFGDDPLFNKALEIVLTAGKASASFLQRRLKIGYNRAARLVEEMEERGIIGPQNGSKPREILRVPDSHREVAEFV